MRISDWSSDVCSSDLLDDWEDQRKPARVLLVMDVSGSMGDVADPATGATKLDLAKSATITAPGDFNDDDEVGLWIFTTDLGDEQAQNFLPLIQPPRVGAVRQLMRPPTRAPLPP